MKAENSVENSIKNPKPGNEYSSIDADTLSFDYFMSLFRNKKEDVPQYLYKEYFADSLLQYLAEDGDYSSLYIVGENYSKIKDLHVITFSSSVGLCQNANIATFDQNGSMTDFHSVFSRCECGYGDPCDRWTFRINNEPLIKLEHLGREGYSEGETPPMETIIGYEFYDIKTNGRIERRRSIENVATDSGIKSNLISDSQIKIEIRAADFVMNLKNGKRLSQFFVEDWKLMYHEDKRCTGSTDGQIDRLTNLQIDSNIILNVKNDGDGWACEKRDPKIYSIDFDLKKKIADWDRIEIRNQDKNTVYIVGKGESDWLILHYNPMGLIVDLEYRSEDPG